MFRIVNNNIIELTPLEETERQNECRKGEHENLTLAKKMLIERIDAHADRLVKDERFVDEKRKILASGTLGDALKVIQKIDWALLQRVAPTAAVAAIGYDDRWIRDQLNALAEQIHDLRGWQTDWENTRGEPRAEISENLNIAYVEPERVPPGSFKELLKRADEAEKAEEGIDPDNLPPIELSDPIPEAAAAPTPEPPTERIVTLAPLPESAGPPPLFAQVRYEMAMMAINDNTDQLALLSDEAKILGISCKTLAYRIVDQRRALEREVALHYARQAE